MAVLAKGETENRETKSCGTERAWSRHSGGLSERKNSAENEQKRNEKSS